MRRETSKEMSGDDTFPGPEVESMKKMIALMLALLMLGASALADVPKLSDRLFTRAKEALVCLSSGEYERLVTGLPFSDAAPSASEWERFAGNFSDLSGVQSDYAVAYWRGESWFVAVPVHTPSDADVEVLVLTSGDGDAFNGYRYSTWGKVQKEYRDSDFVRWNEEYLGGNAMVMADSVD